MKKGNRWLALTLTLLLVFSFSGCGAKKEEAVNVLIGSWSMECDFSEIISAKMSPEFADMETTFGVKVIFTFAEDSTFKMYVDKEAFAESVDNWLEDFVTYGTELMYTQFESKGLTREDAMLMFEEEYGCGITEYLYNTAKTQSDFDSMMSEMMSEGVYATEDDRLYLSTGNAVDENQYVIFTVEGNTLALSLPEGAETKTVISGAEYPFVLTKEN